jgi:uncharacterized NAD(P)/FAD-binding protein YdhS
MDIAIIGAGAAAVGVLDALAAESEGTASITVFEPSPHLWRGRPYSPDLDSVLVNAPPAIMSIRHGDFGHFSAWLGERGRDHLDERLDRPLIPRAMYGQYLVDTAEAASRVLRERGGTVEAVAARVIAIARAGDRLAVRTEDGREFGADRVVLCVGAGTPRDHYKLTGAPGFAADPYPLARTLDTVPASADVAVIGSGLTAVDIVVSLAARGHTGRIGLLSRGGTLPHVWQRPVDRRPQHMTGERVAALARERGGVTIDDLIGLLRKELAEAGEDFSAFASDLLASPSQNPVERLRSQLDAVDDPRIGRRFLQEAAHMAGPLAWRHLAAADRDRVRRIARLATGIASPMVPVNAAAMLRLFDSGQLTVTAGLERIEHRGGRFRIRHGGGEASADVVLNAVNPAPQSVPSGAAELVAALLAAGLATTGPEGGLNAADPRLHVVGDLAAGGLFLTSSIPGVAAQAARAVQAFREAPLHL